MAAPGRRFSLALAAVNAVIDGAMASGKYPPGDSWRECPVAEHSRHAVVHPRKLEMRLAGIALLEHAGTRILMALENYLARKRQQSLRAGRGGGV